MGKADDDLFPLSAMVSRNSKTERTSVVKMYTADVLAALPHADLVAHAVYLQQLYRQAESENRFLSWEFQEYQENFTYFSRAARLAHKLSVSDLDEIATLATTEVPEYFNCSFAALYLYNSFSSELELFKSAGDESIPPPAILERGRDADHFLIKLFFAQHEPFIVEYPDSRNIVVADNDEKLAAIMPEAWVALLGPKAMVLPLCVSAASGGEPNILGGLIIGNKDGEGKLEAKDAEIGILFSDLLSSSLYNARLLKQLNNLTIVDPLTGLFNRRHLINQLSAAMIQSRRHGHDLAIAMLDIDHFKRINDSYGHMVGDKVLRTLADLLQSSVRANIDVPARYGGEEFIIVMPYINKDGAFAAAERLRLIIEQAEFNLDGLRLNIACSIGVAEYEVNECLEKFIDRADGALYKAKENGRNRVVAAVSGEELE